MLLITFAVFGSIGACSHNAEPRWLVRALPGAYPDVVYFVPTNAKSIAMTIDDGLDPATTPIILRTLREHGATATFFLVSDSIQDNEHLVQQILAEGHEIGHHMTADEVTVDLPPEELTLKFHTAADILENFGPVTWFRPGSARYNDQVIELAQQRGYRIALASIVPLDTVIENSQRMASFIDWMVEPGSVVVLHDVGERGSRTAATLELLLPKLKARGYAVVSLGTLDSLSAKEAAGHDKS